MVQLLKFCVQSIAERSSENVHATLSQQPVVWVATVYSPAHSAPTQPYKTKLLLLLSLTTHSHRKLTHQQTNKQTHSRRRTINKPVVSLINRWTDYWVINCTGWMTFLITATFLIFSTIVCFIMRVYSSD